MASIQQSKVFTTRLPKPHEQDRRQRIICTCSQCGTIGELTGGGNWPTPAVAKKFGAQGWSVDNKGSKAICPECSSHKPNGAGDFDDARQSSSAQMATIEAYKKIDETFSVLEGRYAIGHSDKTIAIEFGISPSVVVQIRKDNFGELKTDPEIAQLRSDLETFAVNTAQEIRTIRDMADEFTRDKTQQIAQMRIRLETLIRQHGD